MFSSKRAQQLFINRASAKDAKEIVKKRKVQLKAATKNLLIIKINKKSFEMTNKKGDKSEEEDEVSRWTSL